MPTARGWVVLAAAILGCVVLLVGSAKSFLCVDSPVAADVLVVENSTQTSGLRARGGSDPGVLGGVEIPGQNPG
jgi:hypothetical protein